MSTDAKSRYASATFAALLLLSVLWPTPIVSVNRLWFQHPIDVDELSFLGREAPSWDVVFWCIAGLFVIAMMQSAETAASEFPAAVTPYRRMRLAVSLRSFAVAIVIVAIVVALTWLVADALLVAFAERIQSDTIEDSIRVVNRLGGGMNPAMIVIFFLLAGVAYRRPRWTAYGVAMGLAALSAGAVAHVLKFAIGRTRPELWLGPFHYAGAAASSFPSGHTVAAFGLGGVLAIASRNTALRVIAMLLAIGVAAARVLAFRHWPSDVVASALLSLLAAWVFAAAVTRVTRESVTDL